jgi:hypothetical protein
MNRRSSPPLKILLIPLLGVLLAGIIARNYRLGSSAPVVLPQAGEWNRPKLLVSTPASAGLSTWPSYRWQDLEAWDPFDPQRLEAAQVGSTAATSPEASSSSRLERGGAREEAPRQVQAILETSSGPTALLNGRLVRVGDVLEDGATIINIDQQGIHLRQ